jgi:hypothetical protein
MKDGAICVEGKQKRICLGEERQMRKIDDVCIPLDTIKEWHKVLEEWSNHDPAMIAIMENRVTYVQLALGDIIEANEKVHELRAHLDTAFDLVTSDRKLTKEDAYNMGAQYVSLWEYYDSERIVE